MGRVVCFELQADDLERAIHFYGQAFGWRFEKLPNSEYWMINTGEGAGIHGAILRRRGPPPARGQPVSGFVCTLQVENVEASVSAALAAGGTLALPRSTIPGIGYTAYVLDTEGNMLGLYEHDDEAK